MSYLLAILAGAHAPAGSVEKAHSWMKERPGVRTPELSIRGAPK